MPILGIPEAAHFCSRYKERGGPAAQSFRQTYETLVSGRTFSEGTSSFDDLRDSSLREVERLLFLSISNYRRSFNLLIPSASSWAHVTMYYATFFAATSLLGMFGAWKIKGNRIIEVVNGAPGSQQLAVRAFSSSYRGSHQLFWDFFYTNVSSLLPWIEPTLRFALAPISATITWPIDRRNEINYDSHSACNLILDFQLSFRRSKARSSLPGALSTQFRLMESLIEITSGFARQYKIATDALAAMRPKGKRREKLRTLVLDVEPPSLGKAVKRRLVV